MLPTADIGQVAARSDADLWHRVMQRSRAILPPQACRFNLGWLGRDMDSLVDTVIEDPRWDALGLPGLGLRAVASAFAHLDLPTDGFTLCLMGCDDARIAALNAEFRDKPTPTNVLSWPSEDLSDGPEGAPPARPLPWDGEDPWSLGDIALAYDTCAREASDAGLPMPDHVTHLVVHGLLHLLGYDHQRDFEATRMEALETAILGKLGLADPYRQRDGL